MPLRYYALRVLWWFAYAFAVNAGLAYPHQMTHVTTSYQRMVDDLRQRYAPLPPLDDQPAGCIKMIADTLQEKSV